MSALPQSDFQKMFTTQTAFKRNRHHYDALKISEIQHQHAQKRRLPKNSQRYSSQRQQGSFQSSKTQLAHKVHQDIQKFKFRMSFYSTNPEDTPRQRSNSGEAKSPKQIKGVPHDKILSRQSLQKITNKAVLDQRQFNNFYITKNDLSHTPRIANYSPRNLNIAHQHMNDLYYTSQKKYEEVYFDNRTNSCAFELKKQNDQKQRYFFIPKLPENIPSTDLKPENVAKSFSVATPFKPNKINNFYKTNGRQLPSEFDKRHLSPNKNFYTNKEGKLVKPQVSFTARRYKDELLLRDLQQIKKKTRPYFTRDQVCDEMYFKQQKRKF